MLGFDFWTAAEASAVLFGIFGLILVFLARDIDRWPARLCIAILSSAILSAALALLERAAAQSQVSHSLFRALLCAEALISPLPSAWAEEGSGVAAPTATPKPTAKPSATPTEALEETEEPEAPALAETGIRPEVKEFLDAYEACMDEYVDFMQKYMNADPSSMASMMGDYYRILTRYTEFAEKIDAFDESELTNAELAYYLEVTNRVSQKLLNVAG